MASERYANPATQARTTRSSHSDLSAVPPGFLGDSATWQHSSSSSRRRGSVAADTQRMCSLRHGLLCGLNFDLLAGLSDEDRRAVAARMVRRSFRKGETLFDEGDPGDSLHLIEKGRVAIRPSTPLGEVVTLAILGPGESFGEQALLAPDAKRTASAVALEAVEAGALPARRQRPAGDAAVDRPLPRRAARRPGAPPVATRSSRRCTTPPTDASSAGSPSSPSCTTTAPRRS